MNPLQPIQLPQPPSLMFAGPGPWLFIGIYLVVLLAIAIFLVVMILRFVRAQEQQARAQERCADALKSIGGGLEYRRAAQERGRE